MEIKKIARGVRHFQEEIFPSRKEQFAELAQGQAPGILFITCADSRIDTALLTQTEPGEVFTERNPGNLVPVHGEEGGGVSASIEYAVSVLNVRHVIVCGHSDCGVIKALADPSRVNGLPSVARWLEYGLRAKELLDAEPARDSEESRLERLTELNVLVQLHNLRTHPSVAKRLESGELALHGWVYRIGTGEVMAHDVSDRQGPGRFEPWPSQEES
ncbi:MAG: carbonic anhydrase [Acidobacteriota bacterium]|nr:carbonic anhydrase [Acidobacteriota bacterium]